MTKKSEEITPNTAGLESGATGIVTRRATTMDVDISRLPSQTLTAGEYRRLGGVPIGTELSPTFGELQSNLSARPGSIIEQEDLRAEALRFPSDIVPPPISG